MTRLAVAAAAVCLALAAAGGAAAAWQATPPPSSGVAGATYTLTHAALGIGQVGDATFSMELRRLGAGSSVVYVDPIHRLRFASLQILTMEYGTHAVRVTGIGLSGGQIVAFAAVAVDLGSRGDLFRIAWNHGASHGTFVRHGSVVIH